MRDPSETILICCFAAQETFLIIINSFVLSGKCHTFFEDSLISGKFKRTAIIQSRNTVTFDEFNAALLSKRINFFKKLFLTTKFWTIVYLKVYKDALKADIIYKEKLECGSYVKQI